MIDETKKTPLPVLTSRKAPSLVLKEATNKNDSTLLLTLRDIVILAPITFILAQSMCNGLMSFWNTWYQTLINQAVMGTVICAITASIYMGLALWGRQSIQRRKRRIIVDVLALCVFMCIAAGEAYNPSISLYIRANPMLYAFLACAGINTLSGPVGFAMAKFVSPY